MPAQSEISMKFLSNQFRDIDKSSVFHNLNLTVIPVLLADSLVFFLINNFCCSSNNIVRMMLILLLKLWHSTTTKDPNILHQCSYIKFSVPLPHTAWLHKICIPKPRMCVTIQNCAPLFNSQSTRDEWDHCYVFSLWFFN